MARAKSKPTRLGVVLASLVSEQEGGSRADQRRGATVVRTFAAFERLPASIVRHAEPVSLRGGTLSLVVDEAIWLTELSFLRAEIVERLNAALERPVVKEIHLRLGKLTRPRRPGPPERRSAPKLPPREERSVEACGAELKDPETRAAFERAMRWGLTRKKR